MTQPGQGLLLQLANPFVREAKLGAQLPQRAGRVPIQAVAGPDHLTQAVRELREEGEQGLVDQGPLDNLVQVRSLAGWVRHQPATRVVCDLADGTTDVALWPPRHRWRRLCPTPGRSPGWLARDQCAQLAGPPHNRSASRSLHAE